MFKYKENIFGILLSLFIFLIFWLNSSQINQQGTFTNIFIPLAQSLLDGTGYTSEFFNFEPAFYPLWGYTILLIPDLFFHTGNSILMFIHFLMCISGIDHFYKIFNIERKIWHILFFIPFIALMSVKWPDAVVASLLLYYVCLIIKAVSTKQLKYFIAGGLILGIILNFRSEYIYLPFMFLILTVIPKFSENRKEIIKLSLISLIISLICLLPWAIRSNNVTGEYRFSASNGGSVMYISLGQLPGNIWNIKPLDQTAYLIADSLYHSIPYTPQADKYLFNKSKNLIIQNPGEYLKKAGYNFYSACIHGVYTGEFANYFIHKNRRTAIDSIITSKDGVFNKINTLYDLQQEESFPLLTEKFLQGIFIPIFFIMIMLSTIALFKLKDRNSKYLIIILSIIILYKFLMISLIQYEYRHLNSIYLLVLGLSLRFTIYKPDRINS